jgi:hypothetical protein
MEWHRIGLFLTSYVGGAAVANDNAVALSQRKELNLASAKHSEILLCSACKIISAGLYHYMEI